MASNCIFFTFWRLFKHDGYLIVRKSDHGWCVAYMVSGPQHVRGVPTPGAESSPADSAPLLPWSSPDILSGRSKLRDTRTEHREAPGCG